jgi:hypothetical protein
MAADDSWTGIVLASSLRMDLAQHFDTASRLSPKSAAIAMRLLARTAPMLLPEARQALHALLLDQSTKSEELSSSDLMALLTHDTPPSPHAFVFETTNHRMARLWMESVVADVNLRRRHPASDRSGP